MAFFLTQSSGLVVAGLVLVASLLLYRPFVSAVKQTQHRPSFDLAGWHSRAAPLDTVSTFAPTQDAFVFAVQHSTPVNPDGFTFALFSPDIGITADGSILRLQPADFKGLAALAKATLDLPQPYQWRVQSATTDKPIDKVVVGGKVAHRVYNWNTESRVLDKPAGGRTELPEEIQKLLELAHEAVPPRGRPRKVPDIGKRVNALASNA